MIGTAKFEARIQELVDNFAYLAVLVEPLLAVPRRFASRSILHRRLLAMLELMKLMTVPTCNSSDLRRNVGLSRYAKRKSAPTRKTACVGGELGPLGFNVCGLLAARN
jgi:hypothetical protein